VKTNFLMCLCFVSLFGMSVHAEVTATEKIETSADKAGDSVKKAYRKVKDKTCEMVNGKMECVAKKIKHKAKNAADAIETKATEIKNETN